MSIFYNYKAQFVRVIDGNTFVANVDLGMNQWLHNATIQLEDVAGYTFKMGISAYGELLEDKLTGNALTIRSKHLDGFGRLVSEVFVNEENINEYMRSKE